VARGLADRFGVAVTAVRLAFVVAALVGGWGVVIYLALWILMPREPLALPPAVTTNERQPAQPSP
jgi:phage shock protein PspC (stress-responsive transcriptional regulator)